MKQIGVFGLWLGLMCLGIWHATLVLFSDKNKSAAIAHCFSRACFGFLTFATMSLVVPTMKLIYEEIAVELPVANLWIVGLSDWARSTGIIAPLAIAICLAMDTSLFIVLHANFPKTGKAYSLLGSGLLLLANLSSLLLALLPFANR